MLNGILLVAIINVDCVQRGWDIPATNTSGIPTTVPTAVFQ